MLMTMAIAIAATVAVKSRVGKPSLAFLQTKKLIEKKGERQSKLNELIDHRDAIQAKKIDI